MERYIGLDDHGSSCTFGVIGPSGRKLHHEVVETNGAALVQYVRSIAGRKHLLRAERGGGGSGRIYTMTYEAEDASRNTTRQAVEVIVPHDRGNAR